MRPVLSSLLIYKQTLRLYPVSSFWITGRRQLNMPSKNRVARRPGAAQSAHSNALNNIKIFASRALTADFHPTLAELTMFQEAIVTVSPPFTPDTYSEEKLLFFIVNRESAAGLIALFALTLRRSEVPGADDAVRAAYRKLRMTLSEQLFLPAFNFETNVVNAQRVRLLRHLLLRTDVLRCYSALLVGAGLQVKERPSRRNVEAADALLDEVVVQLWEMCTWAKPTAVKVHQLARQASNGGGAPTTDAATVFSALLLREVRSSSLIDSWATCFLRLLGCGEWSPIRATYMMQTFANAVSDNQCNLYLLAQARDQPPSAALSYLMSAHVVGLVSCCDGGSSYGMYGPVMPLVPIWDVEGKPVTLEGDHPGAQLHSPAGIRGRGPGPGPTVLPLKLCCAVVRAWRGMALPSTLADAAWDHDPEPGAAAGTGPGRPPPVAAFPALPPIRLGATLEICIRLMNAAAVAPAAAATPRQGRTVTFEPQGRSRLAMWAQDTAVAILQRRLSRGGDKGGDAGGANRPAGPRPDDVKHVAALWAAYVRVLREAIGQPPLDWVLQTAACGASPPWQMIDMEWHSFLTNPLPLLRGSADEGE
jgi:hypothetical protein